MIFDDPRDPYLRQQAQHAGRGMLARQTRRFGDFNDEIIGNILRRRL